MRIGGDGAYLVERRTLGGQTVVHDRARNHAIMLIEGVVALPVGAEIELTDPNVNATVTRVRLLAGSDSRPVLVCLDVEVPASYWDEQER